ncbi:MAG: hypothetical protein HDS36_01430 [Bacteroides sp.]|nr:hypothetical protein [Bacteroides sp.]
MQQILVPIFICCVMPVAIVLIVFLYKNNAARMRSNIIIKAIEANNNIDADKLAESLKKTPRTPLELLNLRLLRGCMFTLIGVGLVIVGLFNKVNGSDPAADPVVMPMMMGFISFAVGVSYIIVYFVTRKQVENDKSEIR